MEILCSAVRGVSLLLNGNKRYGKILNRGEEKAGRTMERTEINPKILVGKPIIVRFFQEYPSLRIVALDTILSKGTTQTVNHFILAGEDEIRSRTIQIL